MRQPFVMSATHGGGCPSPIARKLLLRRTARRGRLLAFVKIIEHVGCVHLLPAANSSQYKQTGRIHMTSANDIYAAASIAAAKMKITAIITAAHM